MTASNFQQRTMKPSGTDRKIRINEHCNTCVVFDSTMSDSEYSSVWYTQEEYRTMKNNRRVTVKAAKQSSDLSQYCLRGLEQVLLNGKSRSRQKKEIIRSIVDMYRQLRDCTSVTRGNKYDQEEFLRIFCVSKTKYAQHTANYIAVQDAAAAQGVDASTTSVVECCVPRKIAGQDDKIFNLSVVNRSSNYIRRMRMRAPSA